MTVPASPPISSSAANGVTTVFPYAFRILAASDLEVTVGGVLKTLGVDYTVDGVGNNTGGNVTFLAAPVLGTVTRRRNMPLARATDYTSNGDLLAGTLNTDQDAPVLMLQQLQEQIDRSVKAPVGDTASVLLPSAAARANGVLQFDGSGNVSVSVDLLTQLNAAAASAAASAAAAAAALAAARALAAGSRVSEQTFTGAGPWTLTGPVAGVTAIYINGQKTRLANFSIVGLNVSNANAALIINANALIDIEYV